MAARKSRRTSPSTSDSPPHQSYDLLLLQYQLNVESRERLRIASRLIYVAVVLASFFIPATGQSVAILISMAFIYGLIWSAEDNRKKLATQRVEELLARLEKLSSPDEISADLYVRSRIQPSGGISAALMRQEPPFWTILAMLAASFQLFFGKHGG